MSRAADINSFLKIEHRNAFGDDSTSEIIARNYVLEAFQQGEALEMLNAYWLQSKKISN